MLELITELETASGWYKTKSASTSAAAPPVAASIRSPISAFAGRATKVNGEMVDAFDAFIGGRLGGQSPFQRTAQGQDPRKDVNLFIDKLLHVFDDRKQPGETFADFTDR